MDSFVKSQGWLREMMMGDEEMQQFNKSAERYVKKVSANPEMSHNKLLARIQNNSKVLEFGPASGAMTRVLCEDMGCEVSIVEIDKVCYENVMQYAESGVCADIEQLEWEKAFENRVFDYIIFADVLEHLRDPGKILQEVQKFLKPDGSVLISVPNIAHNSIIIQLLNNEFIYQSTGILDYTHVRHFTFSEIEKLCISAGFGVVYMDAVYIAVGKNEFDVSYVDVDPYLANVLKKRPLGEVYQHILEIKKKEYVEEENIKIENCLGTQKDYTSLVWKEQKENGIENRTKNQTAVEVLCQNPNYFFGTNNEIARLRLEMNEMYEAEEYLTEVVKLQKRIQEYQEEVRAKNNHIHKLLEEEDVKDKRIVELQEGEQKRNEHIAALDSQIKEKNAILTKYMSELEEIQVRTATETEQLAECKIQLADLQNQESELRQTIRNKEGHIELLLEVEREYEREKNSRTYRLATKFRKLSLMLFPADSKRRFFAGMCVKVIRHPKLMLRVINPRRIKNFFAVYKTEGMAGVRHHYELVEQVENSRLNPFDANQFEVEQINPDVQKKITDYEKLTFEKHNKPDVSIVIPVYNQFEYTYNCLASILKNSGDVRYEIIIANDCSTDLTTQLGDVVKGIKIISNKTNLRFLLNCNNAAKSAKGKYIVFLNNDTQVQENWLRPLVDILEKDETVGMTGSKLVYSDGWLQEAGGIFWNDASAWNYGNRQNPDDPEFNYVKEVDYISGASIMIRASLWEEIGGFDERFAPAYYEDADLAFEVRKRGYKVVYQPLSVVIHFEGVSNGTDVTSGQKAYQVVNQQKFYEKWKDVLEKEHFPNAENVFLAKDRSRFKKHILVVDHYVPHYDKDAGGKCTYMYLLLFVKMGFKVTFIGDNFFKHEPYTTDLNQHGIEVLYGNYYYNNWAEWLKNNLHYFDYVYLQRPHISIKYIDLIKQYGRAKILYFAHDLHHIREYREYELTGDPEKLKSSEHWKEIEYELFTKTDVGHVVGNYEQGIMQKAFPDKPIRNIPLYIYDDILTDINKNFVERKDLIYVGGFGHAPNVDAVLWFGKEVFPKVLEKYPDMKWHVVGSKAPKEVEDLASENILIDGFLSDEDLHALYRVCRMAIVPLRVGAGVKGKVVEAAYYQIPLVTTGIGGEGLDTTVGNMILEDDADKMAAVICELYEDYDRLKAMSDAGVEFISKYFTEQEAERVLREDISI